ncbi:MAG: preprotein translocase subunit SecE [Sedimentisphaerales bacterium]|nr:preprotein translocase subunit SecE [Sedimentisphaerales bacterium]
MQWKIYKRGQGRYTRLGTAIGAGILLALGCWSLFGWLDGFLSTDKMSVATKQWIQMAVPVVLFVVLAWIIFKVLNTPKYADFLIATEGEMKKVSWSTFKEVTASTKVVIITVVIMSILLGCVDWIFTWAFKTIGILKI